MDRSVYRIAPLVLLSALGVLIPTLSYGAPHNKLHRPPRKRQRSRQTMLERRPAFCAIHPR